MSTRERFTAEYRYPGVFFPETYHRDVSNYDFETLVKEGPDEQGGYFRKDGWYAVEVKKIVEKRFTSDEGEVTWLRDSVEVWASYIVGVMHHVSTIPDTDPETGRDNRILKSNIEGNSREPLKGYGVLTREGNWQIASDYTEVVSP